MIPRTTASSSTTARLVSLTWHASARPQALCIPASVTGLQCRRQKCQEKDAQSWTGMSPMLLPAEAELIISDVSFVGRQVATAATAMPAAAVAAAEGTVQATGAESPV